MKTILAATVTALLLSGSIPAFAATNTYTDLDSGFTLKYQPSWMEIGSKNFYGLANKPDKKETSLNIICAFTAKEAEEETGRKFTTEEFLKKYKDLQVLERNELSPDKVDYIFFMPDPYEIKPGNRLSIAPKELLDNSSISISTSKKGKQPFVYLHIVENENKDELKKLRRAIDMQIAITSANNMLYTVVSTFPLPNLKAQKEKIKQAPPFTEKKVRTELTDENKEKIKKYITSRQAFLKGLTFFAPIKDSMPYGFYDELLGGRVKLPDNWAYAQVNDDTLNEKMPLRITLGTPWSDISDFITFSEKEEDGNELHLDLDKEDISKLNYQKIKEAALFASSRTKEKNTFAELFNNPFLTNLIIDKFIKEGLNHPSVKEIVEFKEINTKSNFSNNYGTIQLDGTGSVKNDYVINLNAKAMFTPQNFGLAAYIAKDEKEMDTELKKMLEQIQLQKK